MPPICYRFHIVRLLKHVMYRRKKSITYSCKCVELSMRMSIKTMKMIWKHQGISSIATDPPSTSCNERKKEINIILNNRIFSMISHLKIISYSYHHHHHLYTLWYGPYSNTLSWDERMRCTQRWQQQMILLPMMILRHDEPLTSYMLPILCVV